MRRDGPPPKRRLQSRPSRRKCDQAPSGQLRERSGMCQVFASQDAAIYETVTRSVRLNGFSTSIRLEALFWSILDQIAAAEGMSTPRFISTLYDEVLELRGSV